MAKENTPAAGGLARTDDIVWSADRYRCDRDLRSAAAHTWPQCFLIADFIAFNECDAEKVLSRFHRNAEFCGLRRASAPASAPAAGAPQCHALRSLAVDDDFELFRLPCRPCQFDLHQVLPVDRELALHREPAACPEGQAVDAGVLGLLIGAIDSG